MDTRASDIVVYADATSHFLFKIEIGGEKIMGITGFAQDT